VKAIEKLRAQLETVGATLEDTQYDLHCDAPSGYLWRGNGCRSICIHYANNSQQWLSDAIKGRMTELKMGLEKVTDPAEIESHRWETGDDSWGAPADAPMTIDFK